MLSIFECDDSTKLVGTKWIPAFAGMTKGRREIGERATGDDELSLPLQELQRVIRPTSRLTTGATSVPSNSIDRMIFACGMVPTLN